MPTHLVPLTNLLHKQASNWALRLLGNGKPVFVEVFRNKTDSLLCSVRCRELRNQQHGVDLQQVFQYYSDQMPEAERKDIYDWDHRMQLVTKIALDLLQFFNSRTPVDTHQQMLATVQRLEAENAQLRASQELGDSQQDRGNLPALSDEAPSPAPTHVGNIESLSDVQSYQRSSRPRVFDIHTPTADCLIFTGSFGLD